MLKPTYTPTRELVNLDGVWRFAIDTRLPEQPWLARLDTPLEAAVPASYNDLFADPEIRDHVGWVYYQREVRVPRGWARRRGLAALRRRDARGTRLRRRPTRRRAHRRLHAVRDRPHRESLRPAARSASPSRSAASSRTRPSHPARSRSAWTAGDARPTSTTSTTTPVSPGRSGSTAGRARTSPTSRW